MIRKVALWGLMAIFAGALVTGAVIRTTTITEQGGGGSGQRHGQSSEAGSGDGQRNGQNQGRNGSGQGQGQGGNRGGSQGQGQGSDDETAEWRTFEGVVASVDEEALIVTLADGSEMIVEGRAWRYAQEQGFAASVGDPVALNGFYDEVDDFEVGQIGNDATGQLVVLREETGRPLWAGGGGRSHP